MGRTMVPMLAAALLSRPQAGDAVTQACNSAAMTDEEVTKTCDDFCAGKCAFVNASSELPTRVHTLDLFRETPVNVTTLGEKDCGDVFGDTGFYLANHNIPFMCKQDPSGSACAGSNAIERGSQNNVFIRFTLEVDGNFGPYHMCNPLHGWDTRDWECLTYCETPPDCPAWSTQVDHADWMGPTCFCNNGRSNRTVGRLLNSDHHHHHSGENSSWPSSCEANGFFDVSTFHKCVNGTVLKRLEGSNATAAACCAACGNTTGCGGWSMFHGLGHGCDLIADANHVLGDINPGDPCVSAFNFNAGIGHISNFALGGYWYSMPAAGECSGSHRPGDGTGCTWRVVEVSKVVNSTCVNARVDAAVHAHAEACFDACSPTDREDPTSLCYTLCFANAINGNASAVPVPVAAMTPEEISAPFIAAFDSNTPTHGGCPALHPAGLLPAAPRKQQKSL